MPILTPEQREAVALAGDAPVVVTDPDSDDSFVLIRADIFERMLASAAEDPDPRDFYPAIDRIMAEDDAADPYLATYQHES